jgi:hypothetical protein
MTRKRSFLASCLAVVAALAVGAGSASAQTVPLPSDPVAQLTLAGEAAAVSDFLGISVDQLQHELVGRSLADVAQLHGKRVADVTRVVVDTANAQLDAAVARGEVASETAAQYRFELGLFAPMLVQSKDASAQALSAAQSAG